MEDVKVTECRLRIDRAREILSDALEAISGPEPEWGKCGALIDMAGDVLPFIKDGEPR